MCTLIEMYNFHATRKQIDEFNNEIGINAVAPQRTVKQFC